MNMKPIFWHENKEKNKVTYVFPEQAKKEDINAYIKDNNKKVKGTPVIKMYPNYVVVEAEIA